MISGAVYFELSNASRRRYLLSLTSRGSRMHFQATFIRASNLC